MYSFQAASDQGEVRASLELGLLLERGQGVRQNLDTALELSKKAGAGGVEGAAEAMARVRARHP